MALIVSCLMSPPWVVDSSAAVALARERDRSSRRITFSFSGNVLALTIVFIFKLDEFL